MPRTEVYQLRLSKEEKIALAHEAKKRGVSIARMIRTDYGLLEVRDLVEELHELAEERPEEVEAALKPRSGKTTAAVADDLRNST